MKNKILRYLITCSLLTFLLTNVAAQKVTMNSIPQLDQYSSYSVLRVYQDRAGYIWLGTMDGICRYDGYRILVFRTDFNRSHLLSNNQISSITEDDKYIWIGTEEGINLLDKQTYIVTPFADKEIQSQPIKSILVASDKSIWIGTDRYLYHYTKDRTLIKRFDDFPNLSINQIYQDSYENIWVLGWGPGLFKYDKENSTLIKYPKIGSTNSPFRMFQDSNKHYWICTWGDGLFSFRPNKNEDEMYVSQKVNNTEDNQPQKTFFSITQDHQQGYIWVMSFSGVHAFKYTDVSDPVLEEVNVSPLFRESNNIFSELVTDRKGNIWIGTYSEGTITINFDKPSIKNYSLDNVKQRFGIASNIKVLFQDKTGLFWLFQNRVGLGTFNPESNQFNYYTEYSDLRDQSDLRLINCISAPPSTDEVWVGAEKAPFIYRLKKNGNNISLSGKIDLTKYTKSPGLPLIFFNDAKNNTWLGTSTGVFMKKYNEEELHLISDTLGNVTGITEDNNGTIWISTSKSGLYNIPIKHNTSIDNLKLFNFRKGWNGLSSDNIQSVCADQSGRIWIGSKNGTIEVYNTITDKIDDYTRSCGMTGDPILNIIVDRMSHVWILTSRYVTEFNPENKAYRNYKSTDGLSVNYFHKNSVFVNNDGVIYFGGNKGFAAFSPSENLSAQPGSEKVLVTDIKIQNQSIFYQNANNKFDLDKQTLTLDPNDKNIEIDFSSLNYTYPSKIRYAYKLEGIDEDWIYTDSNRQFATYNQLSKGKYILMIKSTDENGLWSNQVTELIIYKLPAFYETWWAYTFYAVIVIVFMYLALRIATNRIRLRNKLKITQIEKEKTEELTQTKLRYFTNISHDFLTPLTIISCLIDDLETTSKTKVPQYETMRSNVSRLKRLLQQVLDFRKMESGNMKLKVTNGNIIIFIKDICYTHFAPLIKKNNINFSFTSEVSDINAYFDPDKIDKIVFNLLSNAFKYTPVDGAISVDISLSTRNRHNYLTLNVSDTGIGIAENHLKDVFTRFYTDSQRARGETNGIGLSLTKDLVELHHGTIAVSSSVDIGTVFTVAIPVDKESYTETDIVNTPDIIFSEESSFPHNEEPQFSEGQQTEGVDRVTILLVEDNEELLILIRNILSKQYNVITAANGKEALVKLRNNNIDIIISDVMMPEMDGFELCREVKSNIETSHISILLLTAKNSAEDRIECYNAGADGYMSKPFEIKVLEARINNLVSNKESKQQEFKSNVEINISSLEYPSADEQFLNSAVKLIEEYLSETEFDINTFAEHLHMSKSSLYRKIKSMTGLSPIEFIRNIRLKHACNMLKDKSISIAEIAYSVGFSDPKYFTSCFKTEFGMTPSEYQKQM